MGWGHTTALIEAADNGHIAIVKLVLEAKANIGDGCLWGETELHMAAKKGHTETVKLLLAAKANINAKNVRGDTALHWAAKRGHTETVKLLLASKADIEVRDQHERTALHLAAESGHDIEDTSAIYTWERTGHTETVKLLLEADADVNTRDFYNRTALHMAAKYGSTDIVKLLLEAKADIGAKNFRCETALHLAANNGHTETVKLLLAAKADVNARGVDNKTALHLAAANGHTEAVKLLLAAKADIEAKDTLFGRTALHMAAGCYNAHEIVKLLLDVKADIRARDKDDNTVLHNASSTNINLLIAAKIDIEARNKSGETALLAYTGWDFLPVGISEKIKLLLKAKADINAQTKDGTTLLQIASEKGHEGIVETSLQYGALIDLPTAKADRTNLIKAAQTLMMSAEDGKFSKEIIENVFLLKAGINGRRKEDGNTALHLAIEKNPDLAALLIRNGAAINIPNNQSLTVIQLMKKRRNFYYITMINLNQLNSWVAVKSQSPSHKAIQATLSTGKDVKEQIDTNRDSKKLRKNNLFIFENIFRYLPADNADLCIEYLFASPNSSSLTESQRKLTADTSPGNILFSPEIHSATTVGSAGKTSVNATASCLAIRSGCKEEHDEILSEWYSIHITKEEIIKETYDCIKSLDGEKSLSFSFELGEILTKHFNLFGHSVLPMAYDLLSQFDSNHQYFKTAHSYCYQLLLLAVNHDYILQEESQSLEVKSKLRLLKIGHGKELNNQRSKQLMSLTQIIHLLQSNSEQQPIVGKLMGDFLTDQSRSDGIPGVTNDDAKSMFNLFLFIKEEIETMEIQLKDIEAENTRLKITIDASQSQETKSKMEAAITTRPPNSFRNG